MFFDNFAKSLNFDALVAANWYRVKKKHLLMFKVPFANFSLVIEDFKGAPVVLDHYGSSIPKALESLYPNIGLDRTKFINVLPRMYFKFDVYRLTHLQEDIGLK
jgi:hypothetical protein